jgi:deoxycytidine triphosphate deaminase
MSIKSDKWIRRMAEQARMIEPFAPELVRSNDTGRIVSYGTSSYGYDVRVANEFKIFTNINSTIVDPKDFDARVLFRTNFGNARAIIIIDEDFRSENASGLGIRALAEGDRGRKA